MCSIFQWINGRFLMSKFSNDGHKLNHQILSPCTKRLVTTNLEAPHRVGCLKKVDSTFCGDGIGMLTVLPTYKCQTYRNSHLFGKSVSPCIFLILIYTDQEHTGTHTFSKCAGKVSDLKRCEFLYVLATHVIWSGTYKNLHLFKIL